MMFFALLLYSPIDLMYGVIPPTPSASMAAGVSAVRNRPAVALFTLLSVAWAERITATSSSKGVRYLSSVRGAGLPACSREKMARRFAAFFRAPLQSIGVGIVACAIEFGLVHGGRRCRTHLDAIDRAWRQTQLAARAPIDENGVQVLGGADDGVHGAGRQAARTADAPRFIDPRDARRRLRAVRRIQGVKLAAQQLRQCADRGAAARRALVDLRLAADDGGGIGPAPRIAAACALR